jgi:hypothetical protein
LAQEKLREERGIVVSAETLRKWMAEDGLWLARKERHRVQQPPLCRARYLCSDKLPRGRSGGSYAKPRASMKSSRSLQRFAEAMRSVVHAKLTPSKI